MKEPSRFISFQKSVEEIELPKNFTFPFYYQAHQIVRIAAEQLQDYLLTQTDWKHNFGLNTEHNKNDKSFIIGKMFGVLVVQNQEQKLGFLAAFSGKLANSNEHSYFVPPVFDILQENGFYRPEEAILNQLTNQIETLENNEEFKSVKKLFEKQSYEFEAEIEINKKKLKEGKKDRKARREKAIKELSEIEFENLKEELKQESLKEQFFFKKLKKEGKEQLEKIEQKIQLFKDKITALKKERKQRSIDLQQRLFSKYKFLNAKGEYKSLQTIFNEELEVAPPAGAGECAAPKLLHYAYQNNLEPIALGEFWWGEPPKSQIRKHKEFYPACRHKCEPILGFMLQGLDVEENPMLKNPAEGKTLEVVYEDECLLLVNKPAEFLSVQGKYIKDSVQTRIQEKYPEAMLVHRLDQSTSGLLVIAKNQDIYHKLQRQFIKRTVKKRYLALLDGTVKEEEGIIDLPLRVDLNNRPHQLVCYDYGKPAQTEYKILEVQDHQTRIYFYPITGRTHQLRVHAAHQNGLNTPILGDDLYGKRAKRLHLHAEYLEFTHPESKERVSFEIEADF